MRSAGGSSDPSFRSACEGPERTSSRGSFVLRAIATSATNGPPLPIVEALASEKFVVARSLVRSSTGACVRELLPWAFRCSAVVHARHGRNTSMEFLTLEMFFREIRRRST